MIDSGPAFADVGHSAAGRMLSRRREPERHSECFPLVWSHTEQRWWDSPTTTTCLTHGIAGSTSTTPARTYDSDTTRHGCSTAPAPYRPRVGNTWAPNTPYRPVALVDPVQTANGYVYQCTTPGTSGPAPAAPQQDPFTLQDTIGLPTTIADGSVTWTCLQPLNVQAIQITVKYLDPTQNLLRQVTIVQSLTQ